METNNPFPLLSTSACNHDLYTASLVPRSDGLPVLREFCASCKVSGSGTNLGYALPALSDADVKVMSYKYNNKTLGEIHATNPDYLRWLVNESKSSDRIRKSAARLLCGRPYVAPTPNETYPRERRYDPSAGWECIRQVESQSVIPSV